MAFNLKKLFGRKGGDDDLDEGADNLDDIEEEGGKPEPEEEEEHHEEGEFGEKRGKFKLAVFFADTKRIALIGAGLAFSVLVAGGVWWLLSDSDQPEHAALVSLDIAVPSSGGLTPPGGGGPRSLNDVAQGVPAPPQGQGQGQGQAPEQGQPAAQGQQQAAEPSLIVVASVSETAFDKAPEVAAPTPLPPAPVPEVVEQSAEGPLPRISEQGLTPLKAYARPFTSDDRPRIAIVVRGLGLSRSATTAAIRRLPGEVVMAFSPYAQGLEEWNALARQFGHETLVGLPMEPADFPKNDPGPLALLTSLNANDNLQRLGHVMSRFSGYVGVLTQMGSQFAAQESTISLVAETLKARGLMYVEGTGAAGGKGLEIAARLGVPGIRVDVDLDADPARAAIDANLALLQQTATRNAVAVAVASPLPATIERLAAWSAGLDRARFALAPVSALATPR